MSSRPRPFARRVLASQLAVIATVLALAAGVFAWLSARVVTDVSETEALAMARSMSSAPVVRDASTRASESGKVDADAASLRAVQSYTRDVARRTGVQFVVVTDERGMRLTHPDSSLVGRRVSTSPARALAGHEEVSHERGTLGETVRAKVPVYSTHGDGLVVGEVSVGIHASVPDSRAHREYVAVLAVAALAFGIGLLVSVMLGRRLRRATLGIGPEELADMARHQQAVLHGLVDSVLGFTTDGELTLANERAECLLSDRLQDVSSDTDHRGLSVPDGIRAMVATAQAGEEPVRRRLAAGERILLVTAVGVSRIGVPVGAVVTVRDETEVLTMARRLETATTMAQALRAQRHEFANRLHTTLGLLGTGAHAEAQAYVRSILRSGPPADPVEGAEAITEPYLRALLEAKGTSAAEAGVTLRVGEHSLVLGRVREPEDVTLILGNLVDNAVRALVDARRSAGVVEVELLSDGSDLHAVVTDSGAGVTSDAADIFTEGVTGAPTARAHGGEAGHGGVPSRDGHGQGLGLALCRRVARQHGGEVWLIAARDERMGGASFGVSLPGMLEDAGAAPGGGVGSAGGSDTEDA